MISMSILARTGAKLGALIGGKTRQQTNRQEVHQPEKPNLDKALQENATLKAKREELLQRIAECEAAIALLQEKYEQATKQLDEWEASAGAMLRQNQLLENKLLIIRNELLVAKGIEPPRSPEQALSAEAALKESRFFAGWAERAGKRAEKSGPK